MQHIMLNGRFFLAFFALIFMALASPALSQTLTQSPPSQPGFDPREVRSVLDAAEVMVEAGDLEESQLLALRDQVLPYLSAMQGRISSLTPRLTQLQERLAELRPAEGESVPTALAEEIRLLETSAEELTTEINLARSLVVEASQLLQTIAEERQRLFQNQVLARSPSILSPQFYLSLEEDFTALIIALSSLAELWMIEVADYAIFFHATIFFLIIGLGIFALGLWRRVRASQWLRRREDAHPASSVLIHFIAMSLVIFAALILGNYVLDVSGYVPDGFEPLIRNISYALGFTVACLSLSNAVLRPQEDRSHLMPFEAEERRAVHATIARILLISLCHVALIATIELTPVRGTPLTLETLIVSLAISYALWRLSRVFAAIDSARSRYAHPVAAALLLVAIATPLASMLGYARLSNFILAQILWLSFSMTIAWLLFRALSEQLGSSEHEDGSFARFAMRNTGMGRDSARLLAVLCQGLGRLLIILAAVSALALPWGGAGENLFARITTTVLEFDLGGYRISPVDIIVAIAMFSLGLAAVRIAKLWLSNSLLPLTKFDKGIQDSLSTFAGYVGFIVVVIITLGYLGVAFQNIAIIAGALSVGIGFGLQSIVNNFVSGLILLAERPIKVGDWIVVGAEQGNVRRINVRSTEIETFDRATIIVPNADLVTGVVKNWMHTNRSGRITIRIGVSYSADPDKVREILLKCAEEHPEVLSYPPPAVFFEDFGDNALIFEVMGFLGAVEKSRSTKSDLRYTIFRELKSAGIEIPFPQRDIHIRTDVRHTPPSTEKKPEGEESVEPEKPSEPSGAKDA